MANPAPRGTNSRRTLYYHQQAGWGKWLSGEFLSETAGADECDRGLPALFAICLRDRKAAERSTAHRWRNIRFDGLPGQFSVCPGDKRGYAPRIARAQGCFGLDAISRGDLARRL